MSCECEDELVERDREIEELSNEAELMRARAERAEAAIERVRAIHSPKEGEKPLRDFKEEISGWQKYTVCQGCSADYPCRTVAALDTGKEKNA